MNMDRLDQLPEITEHVLSGLRADASLKQKILVSAVNAPAPSGKYRPGTFVALCSLSVVLVILCLLIHSLPVQKTVADLQIIPAGSRKIVSPVNLQNVIDQASEMIREDRTDP